MKLRWAGSDNIRWQSSMDEGGRQIVRIVRSDEGEALDPRVVGAKAANLALLAKAGMSVPAFFVLVTSPAERGAQLLGDDVRTDLRLALREMAGEEPWDLVVRSSATLEDQPRASMAGQLRSRIGVRTERELEEAVGSCIATLGSPEVTSYLDRRGMPASELGLHLIVQRRVQARWAGVAMTARGASGRKIVIIEASSRDTQAVTSGGRCDLRLVYTERPGAQPGLVGLLGGLPTEIPNSECPWAKLGRLVLEIEKRLGFGCESVDVEWAWDGDHLWILQARPGLAPPLPSWLREPSTRVWTNFFFTERFYRPVSTLGYDLIGPHVERRAFREPLRYLGHESLARDQITRLYAGRPLTRWEVFRRLHELIPSQLLPRDKQLAFFPDGMPKMPFLTRAYRLLKVAVRVSKDPDWLPWANLRRWGSFVHRYEEQIGEIRKRLQSDLDLPELLGVIHRCEDLTYELLGLHRWSLTFAELFERLLYGSIVRMVGVKPREAESLCADLLAGLPGNLTVEMHRALASLRTKQGAERQRALDEFLERFGHRSSSLDVADPAWREQPDVVGRLPAPDGGPRAGCRRRRAAEQSLTERIRSARFPARVAVRTVLTPVLRFAREFAILRENQRHYWHLVLAEMRRAILEIGQILEREGILQNREDVFHLREEELRRLCSSPLAQAGGELRQVIAERKRARERWTATSVPSLLTEDELARDSGARHVDVKSVSFLRGIAVSPGKATGRAFFPESYKLDKVPKGSVLVMPGLDPAWTPLLSKVVGLITEAGGLLSHGAILAREFGVPAVASVSGAMRLIRPGQTVTVNGDEGVVELLAE